MEYIVFKIVFVNIESRRGPPCCLQRCDIDAAKVTPSLWPNKSAPPHFILYFLHYCFSFSDDFNVDIETVFDAIFFLNYFGSAYEDIVKLFYKNIKLFDPSASC